MGGAIATRIIGAGFPTVLWARSPDTLTAFAGPGVDTAATPAELAADVDLVGICVWDDAAVHDVVDGADGVLAGCRPGAVIAIHSTVQPATCQELAAVAAARGVTVLDAPVSGGRAVALEGQLVVAVGGDDSAVERARPVFATFGDRVVHVGPVGAGQLAKLINNCLLAANLALADDALSLAQAVGVRPEAIAQVIRRGSGHSFGLEVALASRAVANTRERTLTALSKDVACLTTHAAPRECADAALFTSAAKAGVQRLTHPPSRTG
jgi:3-hydroxyisobutyrate dehydrogenase-like beta-hydroxyacid dehydrogenase